MVPTMFPITSNRFPLPDEAKTEIEKLIEQTQERKKSERQNRWQAEQRDRQSRATTNPRYDYAVAECD